MPARVAECPNCGGSVEFKAGTSILSICPYCKSAVARLGGDIGELEILGKTAPLAAIGSPLSLDVPGKHGNKGFTIIGRLQADYGLGPWNEWYCAFDDGSWGWLAEAQGRVYLTFEQPSQNLPDYAHWKVGTSFTALGQTLVVVERRKARFVSAEGELPIAIVPGSEFFYCDLEGKDGRFGTLDFGDDHKLDTVYLGRQFNYADLFSKDLLREIAPSEAKHAEALNCPKCGASFELRAPDEAQRVTCPACDSLLDVTDGSNLHLLRAVDKKGAALQIPLGTIGRHQGVEWTVFGHLVKRVSSDDGIFRWQEYLLHSKEQGYRWLVVSDGHFTWVEPLSAAQVAKHASKISFRGRTFRLFEKARPQVESLRGEFYWKVSLGDEESSEDFIAPPMMISCETTAEEINWSLGHYMNPEEVQSIFLLKKPLPRARGVAPNRPNPHQAGKYVKATSWASAALIAIAAFVMVTAKNELVYDKTYAVAPTGVPAAVVSEPFELGRTRNMAIKLTSEVQNTWLFLDSALINEATNSVRQFGIDVGAWSGVADGEGWSEGSYVSEVYLGRVEPGKYVLRFQPEVGAEGPRPSFYRVEARSGVFLPSHFLAWLLVLWAWPSIVVLRYARFESKRWANSDWA